MIFMIEQSTGVFIAVSRYASATPLPPAILSRGIGWQVTMISWLDFFPLCGSIAYLRSYTDKKEEKWE